MSFDRLALSRSVVVGLVLAFGFGPLDGSAAPRSTPWVYTHRGATYDRLFAVSRLPRRIPYIAPAFGKRSAGLTATAFAITNLSSLLNGDPGVPLGINGAGRIAFYDTNAVANPYNGGESTYSYIINADRSTFQLPCGVCEDSDDSVSEALNNVGEAAGAFDYSVNPHFFKGNVAWTLQATSATRAYIGGFHDGDFALAVNDNNLAVGQDVTPTGDFAAIFSATKARADLLPLKGTTCAGVATGINNAGTIVGYACGTAVTFSKTTYATALPVARSGQSSAAYAVNQRGDVVGSAGDAAFLYRAGKTTLLPRAAGQKGGSAVAYALNATDEIVGDIVSGGNPVTAFVYLNGETYDLNALLPAQSGWQIVHATGVNDAGQIIGSGYYEGSAAGFLLTPGNFGMRATQSTVASGAARKPDSLTARWRRRAVSAAEAVLMTSAGAASAGAAAAGSEQSRIAWTSCKGLGKAFECARVAVPLDWSRPHGKKIELAVIRHLGRRRDERIGSMFLNPGGPGQSGVDLVRNSSDDFDKWSGGRFDLVGWDPRGTNDSTHVTCFTSSADQDRFWKGASIPDSRTESVAYQRKTVELARRCGKLSGDLLSHISTADTARDLDRLRDLVGDQKITYVGLSYGSLIGQTYANLFPGRVRAMMLDGIVDAVAQSTSMETNVSNAVSAADEVFEQFVALCQKAGSKRCALAGHGQTVAQRVAALFAKARRAPIPAPHADTPGELSYGDLQVSTFTPLRLPLTWPKFAKDLDAAANGDASALKTAAQAMQSPRAMPGSTTSSAISCADAAARVPSSAWPEQIARFTHSGKLWGPTLGWWLWAPCASHWPARATGRYTGPWNAKTKTRILLISARYDAGTPYWNAQEAEGRLGNAVLLTLNGYGHPSYQVPSKCIDRARLRYLIDLVTPPKGTVCQPDRAPFE